VSAPKEATEQDEGGKASRASGRRVRAATRCPARPHLLVVKNDDGFGDAFKKTLEEWTDVTWVRTYNEAVAACSKEVFSAIIIRVELDGRSGFEVIEMFRDLYPRTPAMVLTACLEQADSVRACQLGAVYVGEPISTEALFAFIFTDARLSRREREVVRRLQLGDSTKVVAIDLGLSETTVRVLVHRAGLKLGVMSRQELFKQMRRLAGSAS
jgi:DNA-binding NarL/FixJ family response regulator